MPILIKDFLRKTFNERVWKLPLDPRFPCPHIGRGGPCIYCDQGGSGALWIEDGADIKQQLFKSAMLMSKRYKAKRFIAYLQANTTTNASPEVLDKLYSTIIKFPGIVGIAISTRPDAIDNDIIKIVSKYNKKKLVWLELGAQSMHQKSLDWIHRGHTVEDFMRSVELAKSFDIKTVGHIIFGLPTETKDEMIVSFKKMIDTKIWGYKIHALHIIENTILANMYAKKPFRLLTKEEYIDLVKTALKLTPSDMTVHRITAETNSYRLLAPHWVLEKQDIISQLRKNI